ncbi:MAG: hypothetical protein ACOCRK_05085 [bacterium]
MYTNDLKIFFDFDDNLEDGISLENIVASGDNTSVEYLSDSGYSMHQDQYLESVGSTGSSLSQLGITDKMIFGFWLHPINPGMVSNPSTGEQESIEISLIEILEMNTSNNIIKMHELTQSDGTNKLRIELKDGNFFITDKYSVDMWHFFWIVYDGESNHIKIVIDGTTDIDISGEDVPNSLEADIVDFYINYRTDGYDYNKMNNYGYIDDICILDAIENSDFYLQRIINHSADYAFDELYSGYHTKTMGFIIKDPNTITVNSLIDDIDYVYIATNDGKILRGSSLFWEVRKRFSNVKEFSNLNKIKVNKDDTDVTQTDGFMKINDSIVRL